MSMRASIACLLFGVSLLGAGEAPLAPDPDATALWQMLNRFRGDPRTGSFAVTAQMHAGAVGFGAYSARIGSFDWAKASSRMEAVQPVVLHPQLCVAARLLLDGDAQPAEQQPIAAAAAAAKAGYGGGEVAALMAVSAPGLETAFARAAARISAVDMVKTRTVARFDATRMMDAGWRDAGVACRKTPGGISVAIVLGVGGPGRQIGGVIYADADRDGVSDPGEGVAGLVVESGGLRCTTSSGGAWWLRLQASGPVSLTCITPAGTVVRTLAAEQVICDIRIPDQADGVAADRLLADLARESAGNDLERQRRARVAVLLGTRRSVLDDDRQARVDAAVSPVRDSYDETLRQAMAAMGMKPADFRKRLGELARPWNGALPPAWNRRLEAVCAAGQQVAAAQAAKPEQQVKLVPAALQQVSRLLAEAEDAVVRGQLATWRDALAAISPPAAAQREPAKAAR